MPKILGIDIGSLTIKAASYSPLSEEVEELEVVNHERQPVQRTLNLIEQLLEEQEISDLGITGDFGESLARELDVYYVNPHLASAEANIRLFPHLRTILNIGASSSNLIIIKEDNKGNPKLDDIVLPPHCSAGTGSFLNQTASRFGYSIEEFGKLALKSKHPENISGTCAVFAGSDMIDKQQKGARKEDIAAGLHYALIRYLFGTLSKGKRIEGPLSFQGGVAENFAMVQALEDILSSSDHQVELFIPQHHRFMSAIGAAILTSERIFEAGYFVQKNRLMERVQKAELKINNLASFKDVELPPLELKDRITIRRGSIDEIPVCGGKISAYIGVDIGSVSTGVAVLYFDKEAHDRDWKLLAKKYLPTQSNPLGVVNQALKEIQAELGDRITVVEVAVTGSGRKLVADYLGRVADVNEITAHRTAAHTVAERMGISVDEIIEIGGQDSKYIKGIEQFDMNKSCAAGTGSFIEEQSKQLGVKIKEFASYALRAKSPVSFGNKKCTVFIEEELAARQGHKSLEDLLASAAYAVAENYLNQFKVGDKTGKTIFFQGGVALNEAVVAALQHLTNANVIVPEHNEVLGAIGAAIHAKKHHMGETNFIGLKKIKKRNYALDSFQCEGCTNLCNVSQVTTNDGVTIYGGDRCEKYSLSTGQKSTPEITIPGLFKERDQLLRADFQELETKVRRSKPKIGIPRLFSQYYEFFPLWKAFFEELGFEVLTSRRTNKKIIEKGLDSVVAETCFPAEITYGHLKDLLEERADFIFFPCLIDGPQTKWRERKSYFCTLSQNMPFAAVSTLPEHPDIVGRILRPAIYFHRERFNLEDEMTKVASKLGKTKKEAKTALRAGFKALSRFNKRLRERGQDIFSNLDKYSFPIVVVGRPYTLGDPAINVDLPKMILKTGAFPIPIDYLPLEDVDISEIQNLANWRYYHKVMRAAEIVRTNPKLNSIFFSVFSCGPDSFLEEFYREALGGKPFLGLEVGKTTAPAHIQTRVEAFMDNIKEGRDLGKKYKKTRLFIHIPRKRRILYVPRMDDDVPVFIETLKLLGVEARALEPSTSKSLAIANRYIPEKTCLPVRMTAGDYLYFLMNSDVDPENIAFFNHQADGACRQKVYSLLQELVFQRLGFKNIPVITPTPGKHAGYINKLELINGGQKLTKFDIARFFFRFWQRITANEAIRQLVLSRRPYETQKGSMDKAYKAGLKEFCKTIANGNIKRGALDFFEKIMQIPINKNQEKVSIGIAGEGYVRIHEPSNQYSIRHLEELEAVTVLPMASSFLNYSIENATRGNGKWLLKTIKAIQKYIEHDAFKHILPYLVFPEPSAKHVIDEAAKYMDPKAASEAVEGIGTVSLFSRSGKIHGILNLIPAHCMAGSALQCYLEKLHSESRIPVLTIPLDGIYDKSFKINLEVLVHQAKLYKTSLLS
ncbi:MAG: acyl-CoA dehydratase activase-related protein [Nitrospirota bacterium]|nr:acyl-CoA dehydratase activase-related protein [Candidatus Aminicenantes bacterium]MDH5203024.1 acyl-CoA dehydratase activase-related protein [Nitrospirota bacterium]